MPKEFVPAKRRGWNKTRKAESLLPKIKPIKSKLKESVALAKAECFADGLEVYMEALLLLLELRRETNEARLGRYGRDFELVLTAMERDEKIVWTHLLRTIKTGLS